MDKKTAIIQVAEMNRFDNAFYRQKGGLHVVIDKNNLLMASIAHLYYKKGLPQDKIAEKLYISRSTVSRLLQKALDQEIVEIHIKFPFERDTRVEKFLGDKYQLKKCHVLVTEPSSGFEQLCHYAGSVVEGLISPNMIIGLSSGRTVYRVCQQMIGRQDYNLMFTQVKGNANLNTNYVFDSPEAVRIAAKKFYAKSNLIFSPLFVFNPIARNYLLNDRMISHSLDVARVADLLIASVGMVTKNELNIYTDFFDIKQLKNNKKDEHITSMMGHFLNLNGEIINQSLD